MGLSWAIHSPHGRRLLFREAMGQVLSDTCGVAFGGTIEAAALKLGLPLPNLTDAGRGSSRSRPGSGKKNNQSVVVRDIVNIC